MMGANTFFLSLTYPEVAAFLPILQGTSSALVLSVVVLLVVSTALRPGCTWPPVLTTASAVCDCRIVVVGQVWRRVWTRWS